MNKPYWKAVQSGDSLGAIRSNPYYTAGVSTSLPKNEDIIIEAKVVTEVSTLRQANAQIIRLQTATASVLKLMRGNISSAALKKMRNR